MQHDSTVMAVLETLGAAAEMRLGLPNYAACLLLELWRMEDGSYALKILYKDGYDIPDFSTVQVSGCPNITDNPFCALDTFAVGIC